MGSLILASVSSPPKLLFGFNSLYSASNPNRELNRPRISSFGLPNSSRKLNITHRVSIIAVSDRFDGAPRRIFNSASEDVSPEERMPKSPFENSKDVDETISPKDDYNSGAAAMPNIGASGGFQETGRTGSVLSVNAIEKMIEDPTFQKIIYSYLPEEKRNPEYLKGFVLSVDAIKKIMEDPTLQKIIYSSLLEEKRNPENLKGRTGSVLSVDAIEKMIEDPTFQKIIYSYLPEEKRNPEYLKGRLQELHKLRGFQETGSVLSVDAIKKMIEDPTFQKITYSSLPEEKRNPENLKGRLQELHNWLREETGSVSVDAIKKMIEDPTFQKIIYSSLPEEKRNPENLKGTIGMLQELIDMGEIGKWDNRVMESLNNFDPSGPEVKQMTDEFGLTPEEIISKTRANPDIGMAFRNPRIQKAIMDCSENPLNFEKYEKDKEVLDAFELISEIFPLKED